MQIFIILFYFSMTSSSQAYFDPGTGSLILQMLALIVASTITFINLSFKKIKDTINRIKNLTIRLFKKYLKF